MRDADRFLAHRRHLDRHDLRRPDRRAQDLLVHRVQFHLAHLDPVLRSQIHDLDRRHLAERHLARHD